MKTCIKQYVIYLTTTAYKMIFQVHS